MSETLADLFPAEIHCPDEMVKFGKRVASFLKEGDILALIGNLGAGKTHITQGVAKFFGYDGEVTSPTFGLIHEYHPTPLIHADLYRMDDPNELLSIGWEDYLERDAILVIEWADRLGESLPEEYLRIDLKHKTVDQRVIKLSAKGLRYKDIIKKVKI